MVNVLEIEFPDYNPKPTYVSQSGDIAVKPEYLAARAELEQLGSQADSGLCEPAAVHVPLVYNH